MRVFYTASHYGKDKYQQYYDLVLKAIKKNDVELLSPEVGNYLSVLKLQDYAKIRSKKKLHYEAIRRGIAWADVVILEISHEDFQLGHEASIAISNKKPVLCLSIHEDFSKKIPGPYFQGAKYNSYNVDIIIEEFLGKNKKEALNTRLNIFLSKKQLEKLSNSAKGLGMNNSEYLRYLIEKNS